MFNEGAARRPNVKHGKCFKDFQRNVTTVSVRQLQNNVICVVENCIKAAQAKLYLMTQTFRQQIQFFSLEGNWRLPGDLIKYSLILVLFRKAFILDVLRKRTKVEIL
jgi:hypothetical protein